MVFYLDHLNSFADTWNLVVASCNSLVSHCVLNYSLDYIKFIIVTNNISYICYVNKLINIILFCVILLILILRVLFISEFVCTCSFFFYPFFFFPSFSFLSTRLQAAFHFSQRQQSELKQRKFANWVNIKTTAIVACEQGSRAREAFSQANDSKQTMFFASWTWGEKHPRKRPWKLPRIKRLPRTRAWVSTTFRRKKRLLEVYLSYSLCFFWSSRF